MAVSCKHCNTNFDTEVKFCSQCGHSIVKVVNTKKIQSLNVIISFYVVMLVFIALVYYIDTAFPFNFKADLGIEISFAIIVLAFAFLDIKPILKLYTFKTVNLKLIGFAIITPIITSVLVYFTITFIEYLMSVEETANYFESYLYLEYPLFWSIIFIAIMPPIIEELAFRGVLFNKLKEVTNSRLTIIATAFLFALIHFSILSFFWIFPFGLLLGYLRDRYSTLWLGMIIHFLHNFIVLMLDYFNFYSV
ncbi:type II CAAX endopeptidase family protein [Olleya sp. YS]|uniref:CPBP family intramembrane glutamic endopeptidase n=1 Tax=Olleya sp. YS TaxID=3028318 RepID=UPI002434508E|nr:type II CAAX endopeptidase family protein [Olleya sp. YS]WGD36120.1 type II CAAX endopeptidase family protein [Olleya sp. YS]